VLDRLMPGYEHAAELEALLTTTTPKMPHHGE